MGALGAPFCLMTASEEACCTILLLFPLTQGSSPYLGPIFSAMPALLLAFGEGGMTLLWVVLAYVAVNVILPFIMARSVQVHPLAVI